MISNSIKRFLADIKLFEEFKNSSRFGTFISVKNGKCNESTLPIKADLLDFEIKVESEIIEICKRVERKLQLFEDERDENIKVKKLRWDGILKKEKIITGYDLNNIAKTYGLKSIEWYVREKFFEPICIKSRKEAGLEGRGNVAFYKYDAIKILFVIDRLKKLRVRLKLEDIKYYIDLLKFDRQAFSELKKIKREDKILNEFISMRLTNERKKELMEKYHFFYCEVLVSRYWIFEEALTAWHYIDLIESYKSMDENSIEFLEINDKLNDPVILTNIDEVKNMDEAYFISKYDYPINETIKDMFRDV